MKNKDINVIHIFYTNQNFRTIFRKIPGIDLCEWGPIICDEHGVPKEGNTLETGLFDELLTSLTTPSRSSGILKIESAKSAFLINLDNVTDIIVSPKKDLGPGDLDDFGGNTEPGHIHDGGRD